MCFCCCCIIVSEHIDDGECRCCCQLRDGQRQGAQSRLIGRYCGQSLPPAITTTTRYLYVRFVSDSVDQRNGFRLEYVTNG